MQRSSFFFLSCMALAACSTPTGEGTSSEQAATGATGLAEVSGFGTNPGALKMYEHIPANLPAKAPLVVVLHGCTQTANDIAQVGFNELADANGFAVVYPEQQTSNNAVRCFSWAASMGPGDDVTRGKGENESVHQMVTKAIATHAIDPKRVYVAGFSAGAGMAVALAALWPDVFAGAASFAGLPYDCASSLPDVSSCMSQGKDRTAADWGDRVRGAFAGYDGPYPRISIWGGSTDGTVSPKNKTQIARQFTNLHGLAESASTNNTVDGQDHTMWKDADGVVQVEIYSVAGMGHGVPVRPSAGCGRTGQYAFDKGICGSRRVAEFFGVVAQP